MSPHVGAERVHYGRGGAGNAGVKPSGTPIMEPYKTPPITSKTFTTGRGGTGNMANNDPEHPEYARERQDVDIPAIKLTEGPTHTGRGGAANTYRPSNAEAELAKEHNDHIRSNSHGRRHDHGHDEHDRHDRDKSPMRAVRDMAEKGKEFFGHAHAKH